MSMEPVSSLRMIATWAAEAVKAYEAGDEHHVVICYSLMFAAIVHADPAVRPLIKRGLDKGQRRDLH
jgi:hypothetical protein